MKNAARIGGVLTLVASAFAAPTLLERLDQSQLVAALMMEDGIYESIGALSCLAAGVTFLYTYWLHSASSGSRRQRAFHSGSQPDSPGANAPGSAGAEGERVYRESSPTLRGAFLLLFGLALVFMAGEELSWGQRLLGFATPEAFVSLRRQREFNLHNVSWFQTPGGRNVLHEWWLVATTMLFVVLPILGRYSSKALTFFRTAGLPVPTGWIPPAFAASLVLFLALIVLAYAGGDTFRFQTVSEIFEAVVEGFFLALAIQTHRAWTSGDQLVRRSRLALVLTAALAPALAAMAYRLPESIRTGQTQLASRRHVDRGDWLIASGDYGEAAAEYSEAVRVWPHNTWAHYALGVVQMNQGDLAVAELELAAAVRLDPLFTDAQKHLDQVRALRSGGRSARPLGHVPLSPGHGARAADPLAALLASTDAAVVLEASQASDLLARANFVGQPVEGRYAPITAELVSALGAEPVVTVQLDNADYHLSRVFSLEDGHAAAVALVEANTIVEAHAFYLSNSQQTWRVCDASRQPGVFGKGRHESDTQLPIAISTALHYLAQQRIELRAPSPSAAAENRALRLFHGLTVDAGTTGDATTWIDADGAMYLSRALADCLPERPESFSVVRAWLATPVGRRVADPDHVSLPPDARLPDWRRALDEFAVTSAVHAQVLGGTGRLRGRVFRSHDGEVRYLFFEDEWGRAWMAAAELADAPINRFGLRGRYLDLAGMDAPLVEYSLQIPEAYGGARRMGYQLNWNYVRQLPIIRRYYLAQNRAMPPPG